MATLKGSNFRIYVFDGDDAKVVGMATSCTVTLTNNTSNAETKDDVGMSSKPTVDSQSWQVQVESLNVSDVGAMLTAIKNMTPFTLMWDESVTTDNQTLKAYTDTPFARKGQAYLTDATFNFNDRENASKSLTFMGSGALEKLASTPDDATVAAGSYTKGQFVRLFLGSDNTTNPTKPIASAKQLSVHVSLSVENATTKDTPGSWQIQEPTGLSYDISTTALMRSGETITSSVAAQAMADLEDIYEAASPVKFQIANSSGDNQRTKGTVIMSGSVIITSLTLNGPNRQNADYSAALAGYGEYTVGS